ncbi:hypothetical protein [Pseudoalteromonas luteoviolacea]|uniref:Uncharacterized protein n=1 Tax=Pseudoalteromonas luteoviolacea S4054 TaxID=1129367 RepID=A0A0F6AHI3_9GAMM|nr:hypothetical protein [Pseudoalteromonas luteoviolacea]AOT06987.1 hypothetical protein S4054249_03445 [Pseudoalteromonas luteoviolacea]AOT11905.1 hypothetical protein S40542_03445 [Pseudoalteromonas luteoviolacea]AOT16817.1 hypothetical protein S4054_03445 [Pseudoalteromonas luteoviolacea]KKE85672.1 hypothetical protein N479_25270 [Pseudoalteromonas luteoviolacea S4054]KZN78417.1 hypothetical protein N481_26065 [Pseudoalteromonas luteoviolacea S4047-1]
MKGKIIEKRTDNTVLVEYYIDGKKEKEVMRLSCEKHCDKKDLKGLVVYFEKENRDVYGRYLVCSIKR